MLFEIAADRGRDHMRLQWDKSSQGEATPWRYPCQISSLAVSCYPGSCSETCDAAIVHTDLATRSKCGEPRDMLGRALAADGTAGRRQDDCAPRRLRQAGGFSSGRILHRGNPCRP